MELLCPSCQRRLTIDDHFAGQLMKCPMCDKPFTAPNLAAVPGSAAPPPVTSPVPTPTRGDGFAEAPPKKAPAPVAPPPPAPPPPPPGDYAHRLGVRIRPDILQWVVPGALLLVLVLTFFTWVTVYAGIALVTQNGWQAAFGATSPDLNEVAKKEGVTKKGPSEEGPGISILLIFYVLLLVPLVLLAIASPVLTVLSVNLPPGVQLLMPWRWAIVGGLAAFTLLLLAAQLVLGLGVEHALAAHLASLTEHAAAENFPAGKDDASRQAILATARHAILSSIERSAVPTLVVILHVVALVSAILLFWTDFRKNRPLPRIDVLW